MSRIISSEPITPREFAIQYLTGDISDIDTIQDLWDYMEEHPEEDCWDYPIDEFLDILESDGAPVVLVEDIDGSEMRWFETEPTSGDGI